MQGDQLDHVAAVRRKAQAAMRRLLDDLRLLGYTDRELRGRSLEALMKMRDEGFARLMATPPRGRAA